MKPPSQFILTLLAISVVSLMPFFEIINPINHIEEDLTQTEPITNQINQSEWESIEAQLQTARYFFSQYKENDLDAFTAINPQQNLSVTVSDSLLHVSSYQQTQEAQGIDLAFIDDAFDEPLNTVLQDNQFTRTFRNHIEEIINTPDGIQYTLTLTKPENKYNYTLKFETNSGHDIDASKNRLDLTSSNERLRLDHLVILDQNGKALDSKFQKESSGFSIRIEYESNIAYPLKVEFLILQQTTKLLAPVPLTNAGFGDDVAISGDLLVVGAWKENNNTGAAYIFQRSLDGEDNWTFIQKLTASDATTSSFYGHSVAIDGDVIVIGAYGANPSLAGAAYIYHRSYAGADQWQEIKRLTAPDAGDFLQFGAEVAVSGDNVFVGSYFWNSGAGAVYVFNRAQGGVNNWGYVNTLTASDAEAGDHFGVSIAVDGDVLVVGANSEDTQGDFAGAAYIFHRSHDGSASWLQVQKIMGSSITATSSFGQGVAISGDTIIVGAPCEYSCFGAVYVYERSFGPVAGWSEVQRITANDPQQDDYFGRRVAISGDMISASSYWEDDLGEKAGATYVFSKNEGQWEQSVKLTPTDLVAGDNFGSGLAVSSDFLVVGAFAYNSGPGAVYVYATEDKTFGYSSTITSPGTEDGDQYGSSVAISDDLLVIGAPYEEIGGFDTGAVYVFHRLMGGENNWGEVQKLIPADLSNNKTFGNAVAISGDVIAIGASMDDEADTNAGAVYIFHRAQSTGTQWIQAQKITASNAVGNGLFGYSVATNDNVLVVGAYNMYGTGAVYIFQRAPSGTNTWKEVQILTPSDGEMGDKFGFAADIDGDVIIVGAYGEDDSGDSAGAGYIFQRTVTGTNYWEQTKKLIASDLTAGDYFGYSVAVDGDFIVVGARRQYSVGDDAGAVYIFSRRSGGADQWNQISKLQPSGLQADDEFGYSVAISGDLILVGAVGDDSGTGAVYLFNRTVEGYGQWASVTKFPAVYCNHYNNFGLSISISGSYFAVATPHALSYLGGAFIYDTSLDLNFLPLIVK